VAPKTSKRGAFGILVGKPEAKRVVDRSSCRWDDNIKRDLQKICWKVRAGFVLLRIETSGGLF
jgi:hypothetical protein